MVVCDVWLVNQRERVSVKERVVLWLCRFGIGIWKSIFIEGDMAGEDNFTRRCVEAAITTVLGGVTKKNTRNRSWGEFVLPCGIKIGVTRTIKNP